MKSDEKKFFIGIDLGWKEKKTTGVCILEKRDKELIFEKKYCQKCPSSRAKLTTGLPRSEPRSTSGCKDVFGKNVLKVIRPYLKSTAVIAIDAPLTKGRGKGKMRLYEKFLSTEIFRQEKVTPIPPALMPKLCDFGKEIRQKLEKRGFVLDINLIEVFPTLTKKIWEEELVFSLLEKNLKPLCQTENHPFDKLRVMARASTERFDRPERLTAEGLSRMSSSNHQKSALICAILAYLHSNFKTRYLGYKDGFLFLPEMSFWKKDWRQKFYWAWMARSRLKYKHLITNVFVK